jgi:hypothetical protein
MEQGRGKGKKEEKNGEKCGGAGRERDIMPMWKTFLF